ncbi:MAG: SDR family oxidoreductase [Clostridia bacterium]|nr:SDR family oxidoreductase [Clostridia bacterium]
MCIVTGGTGYLGRENVKILKDFGATVVVADICETETRWEETEKSAGDLFVYCDISKSESFRNLYQTVYERYGRIDVVVNCACFTCGAGAGSNMEFMSDEVWSAGICGSLDCVFMSLRECIPFMKEKGGSIINYCSMYGLVSPDLRIYGDSPQRQPPNYGVGKAGVEQLTRYAACHTAPYGIRVNCVTPGPFPNPNNQKEKEFNRKLADKTMLGRIGKSHEMAGAVLLLASDAGSFMTGTNIVVDGGWTAW